MEVIDSLNSENPTLGNKKTLISKCSPLLRQILVVLGPLILQTCSGMTTGYSAIIIPQLEHESSSIPITANQASWIASMAALPMAFGCVISGILLEKLGRKMAHVVTAIPFLIGWILIGAAVNIEMIFVGRFITGLCVGLAGPAASVYIAETSDPKYRGFLLGGISFAISLGISLSHLFGTFLQWPLVAYLCSLACVACVVPLMFVPESPTWLAGKGQFKKSKEAFFWCRGNSTEAFDEFNAMIEKQTKVTQDKVTWSSCKKREFWKPLLIINVYFLTTQFSGVNAVAYYSVSMMQETVGEGMDRYLAMGIIDSIRLLSSSLACILTNRYGRRPLTNFGCLGTSVSLLVLSLYLYLSKAHPHIQQLTGIPLGALGCYIFFVSASVFPIPWAMIGEVFPLSLKGVGSGISTSINFMGLFVVVKTSPVMNFYLQPAGAFLVYGLTTLVGGVILYFSLPETKGKTLQQIEEQIKTQRKLFSKEGV